MKSVITQPGRFIPPYASTLAERWLPVLDIALTVLAATVFYALPQEGAWPLGLIALAWFLRRAAYGYFSRTTPFDGPLLLFLLSALIGAWIGYNQDVRWAQGPAPLMWAWAKLWYIVAAVALYYALANLRDVGAVSKFVRIYALFGVVVAVFFVSTNDWSAGPAKFSALTQIGSWLTAPLPRIAGLSLQPNVAGGMMAMIAPFFVPPILQAHSQHHWTELTFWTLTGGVTAVGLLLSASRGAWIALGLASIAWFLAHHVGRVLVRRVRLRQRIVQMRWSVLAGLLLTLAVSLLGLKTFGLGPAAVIDAFGILIESYLPGGVTGISRLVLLKETWPLAQDYLFTGGGLGAFAMLYSTYALLTPVFILPNGHNLLLDMLIEQGLFGLLAYLGLLVAFALYVLHACRNVRSTSRTDGQAPWIIEAAVVSAVVAFGHSMIEDVSYASVALLLLFVPPAITIAAQEQTRTLMLGPSWRWLLIGAGVLILVCIWQRNFIQSQWYANLGALGQARVELSGYHWPDRLPEQARKDGNLAQAVADFGLALHYDAGNRTANQRLGAIALARGDYDSARDHLEAALRAEPSNQSTWQLLGDAYLALGRLDDAFLLWSRVNDAGTKLDIEASARYDAYGDGERAGWARLLASKVRAAQGFSP